jgi:hypothetical protein
MTIAVVLLALALVALICACLAAFGYDGRLLHVSLVLLCVVVVVMLLGSAGLHVGA